MEKDYTRFLSGPKNRKNRIRIAILSFVLLVLGTSLFFLADRYLIDHVESKVTTAAAAASTKNAAYTADDWNYQSSTINIAIKKVETGTGTNKVTYYVADVQLTAVTNLRSAFAQNEYGRNIVEDTSEIAENNDAILAINGDYYGFRNDGVLIRNGILYRNVPTRTGLAIYKDGEVSVYDETQTDGSSLIASGVWHTLSFGPALIENGKIDSNLSQVKIDNNFGNRSIQGSNPRTGIGMISPNHYIFVVVDGRMANYSRGVTLSEFAQIFFDYGCTEAYNLDGGGSSTMYFMGRVVNNPLGKSDERAISDILYISE